jgi:hypothetical protein
LIEARVWYDQQIMDRTLRALRKNGFEALCVSVKEEAVSRILELVPGDALVGLGGSVTLREMGLPEVLRNRGNEVADHWEARERGASAEEVLDIRRTQLNSDVRAEEGHSRRRGEQDREGSGGGAPQGEERRRPDEREEAE